MDIGNDCLAGAGSNHHHKELIYNLWSQSEIKTNFPLKPRSKMSIVENLISVESRLSRSERSRRGRCGRRLYLKINQS